MPSLTVTLQVPYAENESQFLLQAVEVAVKMFRNLHGKSSDGFREVSLAGSLPVDVTVNPDISHPSSRDQYATWLTSCP